MSQKSAPEPCGSHLRLADLSSSGCAGSEARNGDIFRGPDDAGVERLRSMLWHYIGPYSRIMQG
jgi:hypothetical protein